MKMEQGKMNSEVTNSVETFFSKLKSLCMSEGLNPIFYGDSCCRSYLQSFLKFSKNNSLIVCGNLEQDPYKADVLFVSGAINHQAESILVNIYASMLRPKIVVAVGSCAISGGPFNNLDIVIPLSKILPVDVTIQGCPPCEQEILAALDLIRQKVVANG